MNQNYIAPEALDDSHIARCPKCETKFGAAEQKIMFYQGQCPGCGENPSVRVVGTKYANAPDPTGTGRPLQRSSGGYEFSVPRGARIQWDPPPSDIVQAGYITNIVNTAVNTDAAPPDVQDMSANPVEEIALQEAWAAVGGEFNAQETQPQAEFIGDLEQLDPADFLPPPSGL